MIIKNSERFLGENQREERRRKRKRRKKTHYINGVAICHKIQTRLINGAHWHANYCNSYYFHPYPVHVPGHEPETRTKKFLFVAAHMWRPVLHFSMVRLLQAWSRINKKLLFVFIFVFAHERSIRKWLNFPYAKKSSFGTFFEISLCSTQLNGVMNFCEGVQHNLIRNLTQKILSNCSFPILPPPFYLLIIIFCTS